ncbi:SDR family oxidoreductase [Streptosporangium sp. NBC_01755]|uniref:SDR family NAD(P)-dependent oxidoreductase n=1 Tax=unclassified Streptosporangium TaxID=2632669 RepID=UPI002DD92C01|nr:MULTISPECIES: SDR family oxidoreductase [unclassified Streptosporangium]WSA24152.1 SDR family oxidoreductase [Streptosporangium sp. NBC_01810]WSC97774.1 SDR family oxidoreductase [Streptosporangium sp. NBC_01755]
MDDFDLTGRRVLVTGGGDGLGRQMTEAFVDAGADVVICGRRLEPLERTAAELAERGDVRPVRADVTVPADVDALVAAAGEIDVLVNNAGLAHRTPWQEVDSAEWRRIMTLNVEAPFWLCQRFVPGMIERGWGRVINVASVYGLVAGDAGRYPGLGLDIASYFASKHAVIGMTRFLAAQVGPTGVTVNALCPGMFPSPANDDALRPEVIAALSDGTPMRRLGTDRELRSAVLFLAAPSSSFVTGQSLVVDGGWTIW